MKVGRRAAARPVRGRALQAVTTSSIAALSTSGSAPRNRVHGLGQLPNAGGAGLVQREIVGVGPTNENMRRNSAGLSREIEVAEAARDEPGARVVPASWRFPWPS